MENINIFELAKHLGFEVKSSNLNDKNIASNMLIDESYDIIPPFYTNKIIFYNNILSKDEINSTIEHQLYTYLKYKSNNKLQLIEQDIINNKNRFSLKDSEMIKLLLKKRIFKTENKIKTLYYKNQQKATIK